MNKAERQLRNDLAARLRIEGATFAHIAAELGISQSTAWSAVRAGMAARALLPASGVVTDQVLTDSLLTHLAQLAELFRVYWPIAAGGDLQAAKTVLAISSQRLKGLELLGALTDQHAPRRARSADVDALPAPPGSIADIRARRAARLANPEGEGVTE